jgi:hypothetical protein
MHFVTFFAKRLFSTTLNVYRYGFVITSPLGVSLCHSNGLDLSFQGQKTERFYHIWIRVARDILKSALV